MWAALRDIAAVALAICTQAGCERACGLTFAGGRGACPKLSYGLRPNGGEEMNSSAKKTAVSFLATAALGAAVFMGCTVGSGTVDDTDGGKQPPKDGGAKD